MGLFQRGRDVGVEALDARTQGRDRSDDDEEMPEAIKAYSIAVAPLLSPAKRRSDVEIALVADLNMASRLLAFS